MIERTTLGSQLLAADPAQLRSTAAMLAEGWQITPLQPAEDGLALLQWRDSVLRQPFYLGEVPISRAAILLRNEQGQEAQGGAVIMADDANLARDIAILDAVWAARLTGWEYVEKLAQSGEARREATQRERNALLQRTRVDFSLLSDSDEEEA